MILKSNSDTVGDEQILRYDYIKKAVFIGRTDRFTAEVTADGT